MCSQCRSNTQGAYNDDKQPENAKPYTDGNGAQSESGSVAVAGLNNAQNMRFEGQKAASSNNGTGLDKRGFGA
jgi:hypothetical protein